MNTRKVFVISVQCEGCGRTFEVRSYKNWTIRKYCNRSCNKTGEFNRKSDLLDKVNEEILRRSIKNLEHNLDISQDNTI